VPELRNLPGPADSQEVIPERNKPTDPVLSLLDNAAMVGTAVHECQL